MSRREDATVRLVQALQQPSSYGLSSSSSQQQQQQQRIDLARRILDSQLGNKPFTPPPTAKPDSFSATWKRRISSAAVSSTASLSQQQHNQRNLERLYHDLTQTCQRARGGGRGEADLLLPSKIMTVLTQLIGKKNNSNSTSSAAPAATTSLSGRRRGGFTNNESSTAVPTAGKNNNTCDQPNAAAADDYHHNEMKVDPYNSPADQMSFAIHYEEEQVMRELFYALQGMEGQRMKFYQNKDTAMLSAGDYTTWEYEGIRIQSPALDAAVQIQSSSSSLLGSGALDALRICGEAGWLVRRLQKYVDVHLQTNAAAHNNYSHHYPATMPSTSSSATTTGRVARALAQRIAQELQAYHDGVAQWQSNSNSNSKSLRQVLVQLLRGGILQHLKTLTMITEALPPTRAGHGGTLLSALYAHSLHGDLRQKNLVQSILYATSKPWFHMLYLWTTQGLLPASWGRDFFVTLQSANTNTNSNRNNNRENTNKYLWHDKYTLDKSQIPHAGIFDPNLVGPAFVAGKGINFIRTCLNQVGWTLQLSADDDDDDHDNDTSWDKNRQKNKEKNNKAAESSTEEDIMEQLGYHYVSDPVGMHLNPRLTKTLQRAEQLVHSHILRSLRQDHKLLDHLFALKQFLFHGQGDFFSSLLEGIYAEFGCGGTRRNAGGGAKTNVNTSFVTGHAVAGVYPQQLLGIMEMALRTTNAKALPACCLERLRVEMLPLDNNTSSSNAAGSSLSGQQPSSSSVGHSFFTTPLRNLAQPNDINDTSRDQDEEEEEVDNRTVWDIFTLDYTVPDPLVAIVHEKAMEQYKLVYSFLFGLRKVEYMLNCTWRQSATLQHALQMMAQNNGLQVTTSPGYAHATVLLRKIAMTRQAMTHFCVNVKSYCMLEVLEGGWKQLLVRLQHARTLDEAIQAHDHYLEGICRKSLLVKKKKRRRRAQQQQQSSTSNNNNKFEQLFRLILSIASEFCALQERLFEDALEAAERVALRRKDAENRMRQGQWGFENEQDLAEEESFFGLADARELAEVVRLSEAFHQCMQTLLEALDAKVNGKSGNLSTSIYDDSHQEDPSNNDTVGEEEEEYYPSEYHAVAPFYMDSGEEDDIDSLRFLMFQLDHNDYYGLQQRRQ
jgi:hypothetical protein